ncbi:MAG: prephenate dehydrogenase/arogenate dehydrogenase family protein [Algiphilus sp.]|nr:prephenate dehydrogenase/arogenate dehydrogenase family protein [Algiphilus sp.]
MTVPARIAIVGLGLIGASLARALKACAEAPYLIGCDQDAVSVEKALALGYIDQGADSVTAAARSADCVVIATPVRSIAAIVEEALRAAPTGVVTDTGSVKGSILLRLQERGIPLTRFVPGHPVAGSERFGVEAADVELFRNRRVILTPQPSTDDDATKAVEALWQAVGAQVEQMGAAHHDEVLAATSHLPHVLAYALVDCLAGMEDRRELFAYAAGGFRDFTRIASSSPEMWRDILLDNREVLDGTISAFEHTLAQLRSDLRNADDKAVLATLQRARSARERFLSLLEHAPNEV